MWQKAAADQIDIEILPRVLEGVFKGFNGWNCTRARPGARSLEEKPAREADQDYRKARDKMLLCLAR